MIDKLCIHGISMDVDCSRCAVDTHYVNNKFTSNCPHGIYVQSDCKKCADVINHPVHYNSSEIRCECGRQIECIDITGTMDFVLGNAIKYIWRHKHKDGLEGLKKAAWYLNYAIEHYDNKTP